ncbi:MAG: hypothetical protein GC179_07275 [Anaerolineaceae bacterium]|nr:hypothetical protein [Anaerolineaceae bacterium]
MFRPKFILVTLLLLLCVIPAVHAQDITPIQYGDSVRGKITNPDNGVLYSFEAKKGDNITVSLESSQVDVYLRLGDSKGNQIAENDDISDSNVNASIEYTIPKNGTYIIAVLAYDKGPYTLKLDSDATSGASNSNVSEDKNITYGDTVTGQTIDIDTPVVFTFTGKANDTVNISLSSDEVDTYLVLADVNGKSIAENDDIDDKNTNSYIEAVLPANGDYLIGVFGYDKGSFELTLDSGNGSGGSIPVSETGDKGQTFSDTIDDGQYYVQYPLNGVHAGDTITIDAKATSGDLDLYTGIFFGDTVVAENDDCDKSTKDSCLVYPQAEAGDYTLVITRYGYEQGETSGEFEASVKVGKGTTTIASNNNNTTTTIAAGYPVISPTPNIADWTVLVYMGADNNLEDGLINDLDEFERAGGSTSSVRILALLDRTPDYDQSNGDWTDTRLFEPGPDISKDYRTVYPPTIDTEPLGDLGEIDTAYPGNLLDFIVWGVKSYPAQHYAIILNDHGGAWYGTVQDETTGHGLLTIPGMSQTFDAALKNTGLKKFDLLINDACLMSSVEHYAAMSRYFDYALGSPEITLNPSFDMTLLTKLLNKNPNMDIGQLGKQMADKYIEDMTDISADTEPVLGADVTDLRKFGNVIDALNQFTEIVNANPRAYISLLGQARANTYAYSFFLPEDQYGPPTNIDLGDFMRRVSASTKDKALKNAADNVGIALDSVRIYGTAGRQLSKYTSYYNIYFPQRSTDADGNYREQSPLQNWTDMLVAFYSGASPQSRAFRGPQGSAALAPSSIPVVTITNIYPEDVTSIAVPITISMEVTGRNISQGKFTVDKIQDDGTAVRLETSRIITKVVIDNVTQEVNQWNPGVDDSDFTWDAEVPFVTDGKTSSFEQVVTSEGVSSLAGRYKYPGSQEWVDVTVMFNDDGGVANVVSSNASGNALASVKVATGGEFQTYKSVVTADGRVLQQEGTTFTWPANGITWDYAPAPTGQYNLGFLIESVGGTTGFSSAKVNVNNDNVDTSLRGYVDNDWGLMFQRPVGWFDVDYFPEQNFLQTGSRDNKQYMFVYPGDNDVTDLKKIAQGVIDKFSLESNGKFKKITVDGREGQEFTYTYTNDAGKYFGRAVAVYQDDLQFGLVFASEAMSKADMDANYQLLLDHLTLFNATEVKSKDTGVWSSDHFTDETHYPVATTWMPGGEDVKDSNWWYYHPNDDKNDPTFAAVEVYGESEDDTATWVDDIVSDKVSEKDGFKLVDTDTYYGEKNEWAYQTFTYNNDDGEEITGRVYVTIKNKIPYALWFEAPTTQFKEVFVSTFTIMLDGFRIDDPKPAETS